MFEIEVVEEKFLEILDRLKIRIHYQGIDSTMNLNKTYSTES